MDYSNKFPLEVLPEAFQAIIHHKEDIENWNKDTFAVALISAVATTIGNNVKFDNGHWTDKPLFWFAVVGKTGTKKTHIQNFAYDFLMKKDRESHKQYEIRLEAENKKKKEKRSDVQPPKSSILREYTPESIRVSHKANKRGLVIFQDEMAGWIKNFNQYNGNGQKEQMLSLFNGGDLQVTRVKEHVFVPDTCVNLIGGIQPSKLDLINNQESQEDGFFQRMLFVENTVDKPNTWSNKGTNKDFVTNVEALFNSVHAFPETTLKLSDEATTVWAAWYDSKNAQTQSNEFERALQAKIQTAMGRMCIVIEVLNQCDLEFGAKSQFVSPDSVRGAIAIIEFHRSVARKLFKNSFHPLDNEPEAKEIYRTLVFGKEYSKKEITEAFKGIWKEANLDNRKINNEELFINVRHGYYKKAYNDDE